MWKKIAMGFMAWMICLSVSVMAAPKFSDVPKDHWAYGNIKLLDDLGLLHHDSDGNFKGDSEISRFDFCYMLGNILKKSGGKAGNISFSDVPKNHWGYESLSYLIGENFIEVYGDAKFSGERSFSRAEIALMFVPLLVKFHQTDGVKNMEFSDIPKDHWAYDAVNLVCSKGIMSGYGDNTFRGNNPVTKYEAALMICNFLHLSDKK